MYNSCQTGYYLTINHIEVDIIVVDVTVFFIELNCQCFVQFGHVCICYHMKWQKRQVIYPSPLVVAIATVNKLAVELVALET